MWTTSFWDATLGWSVLTSWEYRRAYSTVSPCSRPASSPCTRDPQTGQCVPGQAATAQKHRSIAFGSADEYVRCGNAFGQSGPNSYENAWPGRSSSSARRKSSTSSGPTTWSSQTRSGSAFEGVFCWRSGRLATQLSSEDVLCPQEPSWHKPSPGSSRRAYASSADVGQSRRSTKQRSNGSQRRQRRRRESYEVISSLISRTRHTSDEAPPGFGGTRHVITRNRLDSNHLVQEPPSHDEASLAQAMKQPGEYEMAPRVERVEQQMEALPAEWKTFAGAPMHITYYATKVNTFRENPQLLRPSASFADWAAKELRREMAEDGRRLSDAELQDVVRQEWRTDLTRSLLETRLNRHGSKDGPVVRRSANGAIYVAPQPAPPAKTARRTPGTTAQPRFVLDAIAASTQRKRTSAPN